MISVIIPFYNRKDTIVDSVNSVLLQTLSPNEVILVDDGSTDGSLELVLSKFENKVKIISTGGRKGACYARNLGVENATSEYIAFQDSDDIWLHHKLELQIKLMASTGADICFSSFIKDHGSGNLELYPNKKDIVFLGLNDVVDNNRTFFSALRRNHMSTQTIMYKRSSVDLKFDESLPRFQDWDYYLTALSQKFVICFLDQPTALVKIQPDSISKNLMSGIHARKIIRQKHLVEKCSSFQRAIFNFDIFLRWVYLIYVDFKKRL